MTVTGSHPLIEALEVDPLLGLSQLLPVVLTLDLQFIDDQRSRQVPVPRDFNDGNLRGQNKNSQNILSVFKKSRIVFDTGCKT